MMNTSLLMLALALPAQNATGIVFDGIMEGKIVTVKPESNPKYVMIEIYNESFYPSATQSMFMSSDLQYPPGYNHTNLRVGMLIRLHRKGGVNKSIEILYDPRLDIQFEFVQQTWLARQTKQIDPLVRQLGSRKYAQRSLALYKLSFGNYNGPRWIAQACASKDLETRSVGEYYYYMYIR